MKMEFEYFRVPETITKPPPKGRPHRDWLHRYFRGEGWARIAFVNRVGPNAKGGATICIMTAKDGSVWTATAYCSHSDNFSYRRGRDISLGRAMKLYEQETT